MRPLRPFPLRLFPLRLLASALLCATAAMSQQFAPTIRIVNAIDESQLVTLKGNTHPAANAKNDLGLVSANLPMTDLILVLSREPAQQTAFDKFVASQYDSNSPNFHQWLSPEQVGANFGPSQTDIATISNWLTGNGFTINEVTKDRMSIRFSGTAGQVQSTFHTEIHNLTVKGVPHIGNMTDPQIPAALTPVVVGVKALHNFFPKPAHHLGSVVTRDAATGKWQRISSTTASNSTPSGTGVRPTLGGAAIGSLLSGGPRTATARPQFGINAGSGTSAYLEEDVGPYDFATIYNILPLWNKSSPIDGTGQTIAIAGTSDIDVGQTGETGANGHNDVAIFRSAFGLPTNLPANTPIRVSGNQQPLTVCTDTTGTLPYLSNPCGIGDLTENSLDVEWSASIAKNAQIVLVASYPASASDDNLYDSESYIVNNVGTSSSPVYGVHIMNVSYGECELGIGTAGNVEYYDLGQQAAAEGIAVFVAAGDSGSASCDDGSYVAESGLTVSGLASTPWNTAVGGTDFNWCNIDTAAFTECAAGSYWSAANNASAGQSNATGYIPEVPWNETCANPLTLKWVQDAANAIYSIPSSDITSTEQACNFIYDYSYNGYQGGVPGLTIQYPYLEYAVSTTGGSGGASGCVVGNAVTNASTGEMTGCSVGATSTGATTNPDTGTAQGSIAVQPTSAGSGWPKPSWQAGVPGIPTDGVRDLPDVSFFASDGFISSSAYLICVSQVAACSYSTYTEPFYQEVGGTSVATPAMAGVMALVNQKTGAAQGSPNTELYKLAASQTYSNCSAETVNTSSSCLFNDIDQQTNAVPCDADDKTTNCTATQSTFGYSDSTYGLGILTGYSAGTGYDLATGLGSLNVANVVNAWPAVQGAAKATVSVAPSPTTLPSSQLLSVTVTVASSPSGGITPTGTVTLSTPSTLAAGGYTSSAKSLNSSGSYTFTISGGTLSAGTDTLTANYSGDGTYGATSGQSTVTVTAAAKLLASVTVTPGSSTLNSNATLTVTGSVSGTGPTPTGTVTLTSGSYTSAAVTLSNTGTYSFSVPGTSLSAGSDTLTVTYSGDSNYGTASNTANITVTESTFTLSVTTAPGTISSPGGSTSATITATGQNGYPATGTVQLTCAQTAGPSNGYGDAPSCVGPSGSVAMGSGGAFTVSTSAVIADLVLPKATGHGRGWVGAGGGAVLAFLVFLGIPARRRSWRSMLGMLVLMVALGSLAGCGGGGSGGSGGGGNSDPGTATGTYTFTVSGIGNPTVTPTPTITFNVTVN